MLWIVPAIIVSYLIGSIPTAYIFVRLLKGQDIRETGSGNVGATNASRLLGQRMGIFILALDIFKGFAVVFFLSGILSSRVIVGFLPMLLLILGGACILGHVWSIFLNFKGGKGVATTLGVLIALSLKVPGLQLVLGLVLLTWVLVFGLSRIVSLASVTACAVFPIYMVLFKQSLELVAAGTLLAIFIVLRHKSNLIRLSQGQERRLF